MTVQELLDFIEKHQIPMNAKVHYQRIEDMYFEEYNWKTTDKLNEWKNGHDHFVAVHTGIKYTDDINLYLTSHY